MPTEPSLRETVRDRYADAARRAGSACCSSDYDAETDDFGRDLYPAQDLVDVPPGASDASLGCGNPTAVAELMEGETVLDLGSGAGIDVLLSAKRVGPSGFVYGIDMTDEMLDLARGSTQPRPKPPTSSSARGTSNTSPSTTERSTWSSRTA